MKRKFSTSIGLVILILLASFGIAYAASVSKGGAFGGKITKTKSSQIESLENNGYDCQTNGSSVEINPIKGPSSYLIPSGVTSKTGYSLREGQWIIGKYGGKSTVVCTKQCGEYECVSTVTLDKITLFGTSK